MLFKTAPYLRKFVGRDADALVLPACRPRLLMLSSADVVVILGLPSNLLSRARLEKARRVVRELGWMLSARAVVRRL